MLWFKIFYLVWCVIEYLGLNLMFWFFYEKKILNILYVKILLLKNLMFYAINF